MRDLFAFWSYSEGFSSTVHGGRVTEMFDDGKIAAAGYDGFRFKPLRILPLERGQAIMEKIRDSHARRDAAIVAAKQAHRDEIAALLEQEPKVSHG
jgi:hypothetical protein